MSHTKQESLTWQQIEKLAASEEGIDSQRYINAALTHIDKQRREIARLLDQKARLRELLSGVVGQFDHQGCTCTFPDSECCAYAKAERYMSDETNHGDQS